MFVEIAEQGGIGFKIRLIAEETRVQRQSATQRRRIVLQEFRELSPGALRVGLLDGHDGRR
jgi:hypothetical protein